MLSSARRTLAVVIAAMAMVLLPQAVASADQFSPFPGTGTRTFYSQFADTCWLAVGPVYDNTGTASAFAVIGGATIQNCSRRHTWRAWVTEYYGYSPSGPWYAVPNSTRSTTISNAYGFGTCSPGCPSGRILETARICGGGYAYFYTGVTVDEYTPAGAFVRRIGRTSSVPSSPVKPKPFNANGTC